MVKQFPCTTLFTESSTLVALIVYLTFLTLLLAMYMCLEAMPKWSAAFIVLYFVIQCGCLHFSSKCCPKAVLLCLLKPFLPRYRQRKRSLDAMQKLRTDWVEAN